MAIKSLFKPEDSVVAGIATIGLVYAIYEMNLGSTAAVQATPVTPAGPHPALGASVKKAGWESLALVAGIALLARDMNIVILGGAAIIACDVHYKHAMMAHPETGQLVLPTSQSYAPAGGQVSQQAA